jgi:apoptosis-inducing factor 2
MKKVVVIGGGFVGSYVAKKLEKVFDVTLIDSKNFFEFTPAILRTIVEPEHIKRVQILHKHYLHYSTIIIGKAKTFTEKEVVLENGKKIPFDYLVVSPGSSYGSNIKQENVVLASRANVLHQTHDRVEKAKHIVIIGGGLVGVELAAEIIEKYPQKDVTILHSRDTLIQRNSPKAQRYAKNYFKKNGVHLLFGDRMTKVTSKAVLTKSNNKIKSDVSFLCVGITSNSDFVQKSFPILVDKRGAVKVDKHLHLRGFKHIFVGGDVTDIKEEKTAQTAEKHANMIVRNIWHTSHNQKLESYVSTKRPMIISLGKRHGILQINDFTITGLIPGILKILPEWKTMMRYR